jgi:hypothetical protein
MSLFYPPRHRLGILLPEMLLRPAATTFDAKAARWNAPVGNFSREHPEAVG